MASLNPKAAQSGEANGSRTFLPWLLGLLVLFAIAILFVIPNFSKYHGDERFYTDAALRMCDTGDYWTPYYANGKLRLLKPILTYWGVAASFKTFGVSLTTSRLPSLLAGLGSLWMTYLLGRTIFRSQLTGLLAAGLLASNIEFLTLSARATPDALVTFFALVSMAGFAMAWFGPNEKKRLMPALLAWCGMGLAVQTKGLLGLCPLAANLIFLLLARREELRSRALRLLDWRALLIGLALGSFWYVAMAKLHGAGAFRDFVDDQVTAKVTINPGFVLANLYTYSLAGLRHFLPWTLLCLIGVFFGRTRLKSFWDVNRNQCLFLLMLFPLLVVAFSFGNMRTSRYVMVSYPALAVLLAGILQAVHKPIWLDNLPKFVKPVALVIAIAGVVLIVGGGRYGWRMPAAGTLLIGLGIVGWFNERWNPGQRLWLWLSGLMICLFAVFDGAIRPLTTPTPFDSIVAEVRARAPATATIYTYSVEETAASELRMASGGSIKVRPLQKADLQNPPPLLLTTAQGMRAASLSVYNFSAVPVDPNALAVRNASKKFRRTDGGRNTAGRNTEYFLGVYQGPQPATQPGT